MAALLLLLAGAGRVAADDRPGPGGTDVSATRPLAPAEAAAGFRVPAGFHVGVFAAEPEVRNPIAMAWDRRGRLWVAENYTYAERPDRFDLRLRDRVLILEDSDGDGRADRRTVFTDDVQMPGERRDRATAASGFSARPACCSYPTATATTSPMDLPRSSSTASTVASGEPSHVRQRTALGARRLALWPLRCLVARRDRRPGHARIGPRPHPRAASGGITRSASDSRCWSHGTTNPWGHDWDALGELFFINTVNGHLWHLLPGSHLRPPTHDRAQPPRLPADRPARRPLPLGHFEACSTTAARSARTTRPRRRARSQRAR